jgi:CelD/BcsL family acetyltransferase involved in cellulose biosynthesis
MERSIRNTGLTNSWSWIKTWLDNYDDTVQPIFTFGKQGNQSIGAALITKATHRIRGIPIPSVHLGTAGEPEKETTRVKYNKLLVAPENLDAFAAGLIHTLQQQFRWSELRLDGFVPEQASALIRAGANAGLHFRVDEKKSPAFDFQRAADKGYQNVISALKHKKKRLRKHISAFDIPPGALTVEWAETPDQAKKILNQLIALHSQRWKSKEQAGAFQANRVKEYHENLIDALFPPSLIAFRVKQGERTIGCLFAFVEDGHVLGYKSGIDLSADIKNLVPGLVTHVLFMEQCMRRGYKQYDFLAGEAEYQAQLSNTENNLTWAAAQRGPRMWLIDKARPPFQLTRKLVTTPYG